MVAPYPAVPPISAGDPADLDRPRRSKRTCTRQPRRPRLPSDPPFVRLSPRPMDGDQLQRGARYRCGRDDRSKHRPGGYAGLDAPSTSSQTHRERRVDAGKSGPRCACRREFKPVAPHGRHVQLNAELALARATSSERCRCDVGRSSGHRARPYSRRRAISNVSNNPHERNKPIRIERDRLVDGSLTH